MTKLNHNNHVEFPAWAKPSSKYRRLMGLVAKEFGLGEWPFAANDERLIREEIERRRRVMAKAGMGVFPLELSGTYKQNRIAELSAAERTWYERVIPVLYEAAQSIYGYQAMPQYSQTIEWMRKNADPDSLFHFERRRTPAISPPDVAEFENAKEYINSLPWFPDEPTYNMMWPIDFSESELAYVNKHYDDQDPIRLPYTCVSRLSEDEAKRIKEKPMLRERTPVEWVREGDAGKFYRVYNMAFDVEMRPHFLAVAKILRESASIGVGGTSLNPQFKAFTLTMADCLESGDFPRLLEADLDQEEGVLYLTFFMHEGYWPDGVKYPLTLEVGIRDLQFLDALEKQAYAFNWLGTEVARIANDSGLKSYIPKMFDISHVRRDMTIFWPLCTGGFIRAFQRDPWGHDYPKRDYPGLEKRHRIVVLMDSVEMGSRVDQALAAAVFGKEIADVIDPIRQSGVQMTILHEASHGVEFSQTDAVLSGKTFNEAFGKLWGIVVEPWADIGGAIAYEKLCSDGVIDENALRGEIYFQIVHCAMRLQPREVVTSDDMILNAPHMTGSSMLLGWLYKAKALYRGGDALLSIDLKRACDGCRSFFDELTAYAARGDAVAFEAFVHKCIGEFPQDVEKEIIDKKKRLPPYSLLDRGELGPLLNK